MSEQLSPIELGDIVSISLEVNSRFYYDEQANTICGFHGESVIPFSGSPALLTAKPARDFDWAMLGIIQTSQIRVRTVFNNRDWNEVEQFVSEWLPVARRAINGFGPEVVMYNVRLPQFVPPVVRRYLPYFRKKLGQS